ncbi:hypothetical protein [Arthrobacter sp. CG_A4]|uniref:hypothetical protein n=1 Tax=Arthrobacter sp. CG_A4 TaxID=3071706 RepID=UPI002E08299C|nr:hypothetical protein [Arthrobacter sp. CG_A4]
MTESHEELRSRVRGSYTLEAGTEMLIRAFGGRFVEPGNPWIDEDPMSGKTWIDFGEIPSNVGALSGGEREFLMLAASVAADVPVGVGEILDGLDRPLMELALAAFAHASGLDDGLSFVRGERPGTLYPWPEETTPDVS